jgi:hypothetical protein
MIKPTRKDLLRIRHAFVWLFFNRAAEGETPDIEMGEWLIMKAQEDEFSGGISFTMYSFDQGTSAKLLHGYILDEMNGYDDLCGMMIVRQFCSNGEAVNFVNEFCQYEIS